MKKYFLHLACTVAIIICGASCRMNVLKGEGNKATNIPAVTPFSAVDVNLPLNVGITVQDGAQPGITLSGYENLIKHIKTKVENNTLHVFSDLDETWLMDHEGISVQIVLPAITALSLEGATDAEVHGNITGNEFNLDISGASNAVLDNINVNSFSTVVKGAANIEVKSGTVKTAKYELSGAGKIKAFPLQATETSAFISGAGKGEVTASEKLSAIISGAGTIKYKGHPAVTKDISGAGSIAEAN